MSRSYRKVPGHCDRNPYMKNYSNRVARRSKLNEDGFSNGNNYRKFTGYAYDIHDWKCLYHHWQDLHKLVFNSKYYKPDDLYKFYMK